MKKIGLISDTHGFVHPELFKFFDSVDEIWHAGDIGAVEVIHQLEDFKPVRAVYGNIDGYPLRHMLPEKLSFTCEAVRVAIIHIGGYPGRYSPAGRELIRKSSPKLFISGHSHILKVMYDHKFDLLHINPGAAGISGLHKKITWVRFEIHDSDIRNLEIHEIGRR
ncbi:MAG: metallophosphoesterase family protein [Bacteroidales bacterium]